MAAAWCERLLENEFVVAEIRSAGTHAWSGSEAAGYAVDVMRELDFDLRGHRSQRLSPELMDWADHVVVMEPMHAEVARKLAPVRDESPVIHGLWEWFGENVTEVWDPQGADLDGYRRSAQEIGGAMGQFIEQLLRKRRAGG